MGFSEADRARLLQVKGVGPRVVERLEQIGFSSLADLAAADPDAVVHGIAGQLGTTCWRNSPQARRAIADAIAAAGAAPL